MERISESASAKINLTLQVVGRRKDGYHLLSSLVGFAGVGDVLHFMPSKKLSLSISGPFASELKDTNLEDNLVMRSAKRLSDIYGGQQGAELHLVKNLPIASGIGGGSADAAAALRGLSRLWGVDAGIHDQLGDLALCLGADVPVCLKSKCTWMEGIGDKLSPGPTLPDFHIVLLNPGIGVSTPKIFKNLGGVFSSEQHKPQVFSTSHDFTDYLSIVGNDLESPACQLEPTILKCLGELQRQKDCDFSGMSGSGATCFGIFQSKECAENAVANIAQKHPDWWGCATVIS